MSTAQWQRLVPLAIVFYIMRGLQALVRGLLPAMAGAYAWLSSSGSFYYVFLGICFALLAVVGYGLAAWRRFEFAFEDDRILVRRGVFSREDLSIRFARIQNLHVRQPFIARWFEVFTVGIETAGSGGKEVSLPGVRAHWADALRQAVDRKPADSTIAQRPTLVRPPDLQLSTPELLRYGLINANLLWVAVIIGFLSSVGAELEWWEFVDWNAIGDSMQALGAATALIGSLLALLVGGALLIAISLVTSIIRYHDFQMRLDGDRLQIESGALTRHQVSLELHKIQAIERRQNAVARWLNRETLIIRQAEAGAAGQDAQSMSATGKQRLRIPVLAPEQADQLQRRLLPGSVAPPTRFTRPNWRQLRLSLLFMTPWLLAPSLLVAGLTDGFLTVTVVSLLTWLVLAAVLIQLWRRKGLAMDGGFGWFREGFVGWRYTVFPLFKAQRIDLNASWFQRRLHYSGLRVYLASQSLWMPYLPRRYVEQFADITLLFAERSHRRWL